MQFELRDSTYVIRCDIWGVIIIQDQHFPQCFQTNTII